MNKCILCGNTDFKVLYTGDGWKISKCKKCRLVYTKRDKLKISEEYHRDSDYIALEKQFENIFKKRFEIINKYIKNPGRVVDIGSSTGVLLKLFKDFKWEELGIEPSKSANYAIKKNINIINKKFEDVNLPKNKYDLVILNHTLEHLENPLTVLNRVYEILKKGGLVFIDVPNFGSLSSMLFGKNYSFLLPEEHNFHFTQKTLTKLLQKSKFKVKYSETRSGLFDYQNPFLELWMSLSGFKKRFITNLIRLPLDVIEKLLNKGTAISIIGQK